MTAFMNHPHLIHLDQATITQAKGLAQHLINALDRDNMDQADTAERRLKSILRGARVPESSVDRMSHMIAMGEDFATISALIGCMYRRNR